MPSVLVRARRLSSGTAPSCGSPRRSVLAILLLNLNRVVSTDQLVELLWPHKPPGRPQTAVQGYVSALRKLLGRETIETSGGGYLVGFRNSVVCSGSPIE
jgi:DNA-binding SARP family transcriptional activator